ncbi:hypothetical protein MJ122_27395 [Pseudomonas sp. DP-17]|nr:hypothetical protein [Pseudomonas sp. DP-17]
MTLNCHVRFSLCSISNALLFNTKGGLPLGLLRARGNGHVQPWDLNLFFSSGVRGNCQCQR